MPRRRPSARVLLLALTASITAFFASCGIPNLYPNNISTINVRNELSKLSTEAAFRHTINTDVEVIGYNFYYVYSEKNVEENSEEIESNVKSAVVEDRNNKTPQLEIVDKSNNPIYGAIKFGDDDINSFTCTLYPSFQDRIDKTNPISLHNGETRITIKDNSESEFSEVDKNLHLYIEYILVDTINMYDFPPKEKIYLGYLTLE